MNQECFSLSHIVFLIWQRSKQRNRQPGNWKFCGLALLSHDEKKFLKEVGDKSITFRYPNSFILVMMICKYFLNPMIWEINKCSVCITRNIKKKTSICFVTPVWLTVLFTTTHDFPCTFTYLVEGNDLQPAFQAIYNPAAMPLEDKHRRPLSFPVTASTWLVWASF